MNTVLRAILRGTVYRLLPRNKTLLVAIGLVAFVVLVFANGAKAEHSFEQYAADGFGRSVSTGAIWGTADVGGAWARSGSSHDVYSVDGSTAVATPTTTTNGNQILTSVSQVDVDQKALFTWSTTAAGGNMFPAGLIARYVDSSNFYSTQLRIEPATNTTLRVDLRKHVAAVSTGLGTTTVATGFTAGTPVWVRFQVEGSTLRVKVWLASVSEPASWTATTTDTDHTAPGAVGFRYSVGSGNTATPTVTMDDYVAQAVVGTAHEVPPTETVVILADEDRDRLDLSWWGIWALVGLSLVSMIAPTFLRLLDIRHGMGNRFS